MFKEPEVPNYDPTAAIKDKPVLQNLSCTSKSQKKLFRQQEEQRFQEIEARGPINTNPTPNEKVTQFLQLFIILYCNIYFFFLQLLI